LQKSACEANYFSCLRCGTAGAAGALAEAGRPIRPGGEQGFHDVFQFVRALRVLR